MNVTDWAIGHLGQSYTTENPWASYWAGYCLTFTDTAWTKAGGGKPLTAYYAIDQYRAYYATSLFHRVEWNQRPPRGALIYFNSATEGHVAISLGNWQAIGTQGKDPSQGIAIYGVNDPGYRPYLGWAMPLPPTVPQNPS